MEKTKKINWFDFKKSKITGTSYLKRYILGYFLLILIIPGIWLIASTVYKRSRSFEWSKETSMVFAIFGAIMGPINLVLNELDDANAFFLFLLLLWSVIHLILLFKYGNLKNQIDSSNEVRLNEDTLVINSEIELDGEKENQEDKTDSKSNDSNDMKFQTDVDHNWLEGGKRSPR